MDLSTAGIRGRSAFAPGKASIKATEISEATASAEIAAGSDATAGSEVMAGPEVAAGSEVTASPEATAGPKVTASPKVAAAHTPPYVCIAWARASSRSRSRALRVMPAARSNCSRASPLRPSLASRSPRTLGNQW
ncbi:hypothetical protein LMG1861_03016 [Achromobacter piechaudii]|uniref:Uncharacterized protein n=1 Tax=Achromobacter piechaudii TaxID=72556 RepID=A0A6S7DZF4_9BURK|nr:hypothetical protein LMG1861_03016 [Achromobacter piechaudii]